ncbi:hypothetical protein AN1V17_23790 [Vallitalea sediminicola]
MKKFNGKTRLLSLMLILGLLLVNLNVSAINKMDAQDLLERATEQSIELNSEVFQSADSIVDLTPVNAKSTSKVKKESNKFISFIGDFFASESSTPTNTSNIECIDPFLANSYAIAKSSSTVMEDYIYAKCRIYNGGDDSLVSSTEEDENYSSFVSAKAIDSGFYSDDYAYGNHIYKLEGYKDVIHETYDEF